MGHAKLEMPLDIQAVMSNRWFCIGVRSPVGDINLGPRKIRATKWVPGLHTASEGGVEMEAPAGDRAKEQEAEGEPRV